VIGLEVFARVKNTQLPVRATSVPSVTKTFAFLPRLTEDDTATKQRHKDKSIIAEMFLHVWSGCSAIESNDNHH